MNRKRQVFAEVGSGEEVGAAVPTGGPSDDWKGRPAIRLWLLSLLVLLVLTVLAGGITRLFDAGLSITEWKPVAGILPPMGNAAWNSEFEKYQQIPEFALQNSHMTLAEFRTIYWLEWGHRQAARALGLVWALGFLWFWLRRKLRAGWTSRLLWLGALGGLQGVIGWWMVSSGLTGSAVDVASWRLAVHLGLAFIIAGMITWYMLLLGHESRDLFQARRSREHGLGVMAGIMLCGLFVQIVLGAIVSGIDAGSAFPSWPLMNGQLLPADSLVLEPVTANFLQNPALVQFNHRMFAYLIVLFLPFLWWRARQSPNAPTRHAAGWLAGMVLVQAALGIVTVVQAASASTAILHQLGAVIVFLLALRLRFLAMYPARSLA